MADVFISYSHEDTAQAKAISALLESDYSVAIDTDFIELGEAYRERIFEELQRARVVVVLWSRRSVASSFVRDEANRASRRTVLLPLIIDDLGADDLPLGFGETHTLQCRWDADGTLAAATRNELISAVARYVHAGIPLDAAVAQLEREVDSKLGNEYTDLQRIGTGRMSVVFKARHVTGNVGLGSVALKVTPLAGVLLLPGFFAELRANLEAARQLSHENILKIHDVRLHQTIACTIMEYVDGTSLARRLAKEAGKMSLVRVKDIASDVAKALAHAHSNDVVHGSLSPTDILIAGPDRYVVSDFGMPKTGTSSPEAMAVRALFGDVRYVSPEQCMGEDATPQSDQYALGAILYEMLAGRPPFGGPSAFVVMKKHCEQVPVPIGTLRPDCPAEVAHTIMRLLSKRPEDRYVTTGMLVRVINGWLLAPSSSKRSIAPSPVQSAKNARDSFDRCVARPDFLATFYESLRTDKELAEFLMHVRNFDHLVSELERAIRHLLEAADAQDDADCHIRRVAKMHQGLGLTELHLQKFMAILINLVADNENLDPARRARLCNDWHEATFRGLRLFIDIAVAQPRHGSGIVPVESAGSSVQEASPVPSTRGR